MRRWLAGTPIDLSTIKTPSYILSTREDHIAPWKSTYAATQIYKGPVRFVLSASGHIAGVVNPPAAQKYSFFLNDNKPKDPDAWFKDAVPSSKAAWKLAVPLQGFEIPIETGLPISAWTAAEPPRIMGQSLKRADSLGIWYLHVWTWEASPNGLFSDWNPRVKCPKRSM